VKVGPVDPEINGLQLKIEEIDASKIYSPVGNCAERAKLQFIHTVNGDELKTAQIMKR